MLLAITDESELEELIVHFLANQGIIDDGKRYLDCRFRGEYDLGDLYNKLEPASKAAFNSTCVRMLQEYDQLPPRHPQFSDEISREFMGDVGHMVSSKKLDVTSALPQICGYVEHLTLTGRSEVLHHSMINVLAEVGKDILSREKWQQLYDTQPNKYKAHLHTGIIDADVGLAEELLPTLKAAVDSNAYLENVFWTVHHQCNPQHGATNELATRERLLQYASREEWVGSELGKGFTEKGIRAYFG